MGTYFNKFLEGPVRAEKLSVISTGPNLGKTAFKNCARSAADCTAGVDDHASTGDLYARLQYSATIGLPHSFNGAGQMTEKHSLRNATAEMVKWNQEEFTSDITYTDRLP